MTGETLFCICAVGMVMRVCEISRLRINFGADNEIIDVLKYLLPLIPSSLLQVTNESKSPPLHWAITNNKTDCVKILCELPESEGGGLPLLRVSRSLVSATHFPS